jgi:zinc/manganese transport system substrate-binding protein
MAALALSIGLAGCATTAPAAESGPGSVLRVAASINAWGSILGQLGGSHVHATSIIDKPAIDPHAYEPTPADARTIADAQLFVENGIGYDPWAARALAASPDSKRVVVDVGTAVGVTAGGNPHRWYSPADVATVADAITAGLKRLDPADAAYFDARRASFDTVGLAQYHRLISEIRARYAHTPIGASESIVDPLASALGLRLLTPSGFLKAITEGTDPSTSDKATIDGQIAHNAIAVYVYNTQNSTPDVSAQVSAARRHGIPVVGITETLSPATASFQGWQVAQLIALRIALAQAVSR